MCSRQIEFSELLKNPSSFIKSLNATHRYGFAIACGVGAAVLAGVLYKSSGPLYVPVFLKKMKRSLSYICYPADIYAMLLFKFTTKLPSPPVINDDWTWCYEKLLQTSRSFAAVILELHPKLRESVCAFYLVLRGLDSVEDDMAPPVQEKITELRNFYTHLQTDGWNLKGFGEKKHEIDLLENFNRVIAAMKTLEPKHHEIITDICKRMGYGMAEFLEKKVVTVEDWNLYCHYVAGLVGYGLSALFGASGLEDERFGTESFEGISNSMGLFLQKTNIIRDILEDSLEDPPRLFWPTEVVQKYTENIPALFKWENRYKALHTLNDLVTNAIDHAFDALDYLKLLKDETVFKFCAIPQVMAIATLDLCYNNYDVYLYEVKIRKGEAVRLILGTKNYKAVCQYFLSYAQSMKNKIPSNDPNRKITESRLSALIAKCQEDLKN